LNSNLLVTFEVLSERIVNGIPFLFAG
jgi:hypothetical protein